MNGKIKHHPDLPRECPATREHLEVHLHSLRDAVTREDWEQVQHDLCIIMDIDMYLHLTNPKENQA